MKFVVDTNILIDLYHGGLLVTAFSTGDEWIITDLAAEELETPGSKHLISLGLEVRRISGDQMDDVVELVNRYPAPSVQDLSLLLIAKEEDILLVTGDNSLRRAAIQESVPVHGTLWYLDMLLEQGIIAETLAIEALESMVTNESRLPRDEVAKRLRTWRGSP